MTVRVLGLTTTATGSFYRHQEAAVADAGANYETLAVPGTHRADDGAVRGRSLRDYARFYPRVLRRSLDSYDLVHANYGLTAPFALAQPRRPVVLTLWGGEFVANRFAPLVRACCRGVDALVVPSAAMADRLPAAVRNRARVVPFPVDTERFRPAPRDRARERVGWDTDGRVVLFPYALARYEKNYPLAERVVEGLDADVELRRVANEPYERMPDYVNASDALLVTSRWESGPMTVKEALACGLPVVSRPVGFVPEVLDGVDGCRVGATERELRAGLAAALDAGAADGAAARRARVTGYGIPEMGERLREIYEDCLDER